MARPSAGGGDSCWTGRGFGEPRARGGAVRSHESDRRGLPRDPVQEDAVAADMPLPHTHVTLANGLDVLVHEDHDCPIVAVNIWYHVGSKNEKPGRTGFAHLFEHLMFEGSEHHDKGLLPAAAGSRRHAQRVDQRRSHQLLGSRADQRPRAGVVDGIGSNGLSAARRSPRRNSRTSATSC